MVTRSDNLPDDSTSVPAELLQQSKLQRFHAWKATAAVRACVPLNRIFPAARCGWPGILMYHRVVPVAKGINPTWNVTPERFREQLAGLLRRGLTAWPLSRLVRAVEDNRPIPENVFVVTFDDGYSNNLTYALPVLKELRIAATIFLATGWVGSQRPFAFDDWPHKGRPSVPEQTWRPLTLEECHRLAECDLIELASHTHSHADFRGRPQQLTLDLRQSIDYLKTHFHVERPLLSLPYGIVRRGFAGPEFSEIAREAGCRCCLTTEEQLIEPRTSPFEWGRFIAEQHDTAETLSVKLSGWRDKLRNSWRRLRGRS